MMIMIMIIIIIIHLSIISRDGQINRFQTSDPLSHHFSTNVNISLTEFFMLLLLGSNYRYMFIHTSASYVVTWFCFLISKYNYGFKF